MGQLGTSPRGLVYLCILALVVCVLFIQHTHSPAATASADGSPCYGVRAVADPERNPELGPRLQYPVGAARRARRGWKAGLERQ